MSSPKAQGAASLSSGGSVWTLRAQEGRLYLFNNQGREKDCEGDRQDAVEGVELSSLLAEENGETCVSLPCTCQYAFYTPRNLSFEDSDLFD